MTASISPHGGRRGRHIAHQFAQHARVVRALTGEEKGHARLAHRHRAIETTLLFEHGSRIGIRELLGGQLKLFGQGIGATGNDRQSRAVGGSELRLCRFREGGRGVRLRGLEFRGNLRLALRRRRKDTAHRQQATAATNGAATFASGERPRPDAC